MHDRPGRIMPSLDGMAQPTLNQFIHKHHRKGKTTLIQEVGHNQNHPFVVDGNLADCDMVKRPITQEIKRHVNKNILFLLIKHNDFSAKALP